MILVHSKTKLSFSLLHQLTTAHLVLRPRYRLRILSPRVMMHTSLVVYLTMSRPLRLFALN